MRHPGGGIWHHREHRGQAGCPGGGIKCYTDFMEHTGEGIMNHIGKVGHPGGGIRHHNDRMEHPGEAINSYR